MNERIQELHEQAMVTIPAAEGPLSHTYFDREKFAELIVKECCDVFYDHDIGVYKAYYVIKEHFGIE